MERKYLCKIRYNTLTQIFIISLISIPVIIILICIICDKVAGNKWSASQILIALSVFLIPGVISVCALRWNTVYIYSHSGDCCYKPLLGQKRYFNVADVVKIEVKTPRAGLISKDEEIIEGYDKHKKKLFRIRTNMSNADKLIDKLYANSLGQDYFGKQLSFDELVEQALGEIKTYLELGREIPYYTNQKQLEKIKFELLKMLKVRDIYRFTPSYYKIVTEEWDNRNQLGHDLVDAWVEYEKLHSLKIPKEASEVDYARARFIISEIIKDKRIELDGTVLASMTLEIMHLISRKGEAFNSEMYWKYGNEYVEEYIRKPRNFNVIDIEKHGL